VLDSEDVEELEDEVEPVKEDLEADEEIDEDRRASDAPTISTKGLEPLKWWYAIGNSNPLARMAIDFLSAPSKPIIPFNKFLH
jgi:hypothetical protein